MLGGCGTGRSAPSSAGASADPPTAAACASASLTTLQQVAERVYAEAAEGRIVSEALKRLRRSSALAGAVQRDDPAATRRVLRSLVLSQIVRVRVTHGARLLADIGKRNAIAPVAEPLRDAAGREIGRALVSVDGANGLAFTIRGLTNAEVLLLAGSHPVASTLGGGAIPTRLAVRSRVSFRGVSYQVRSFRARAFPARPLRIALLVPKSALAPCAATLAETVANTIGSVGMRIYADERSGPKVAAVVRHVERSRAFRNAVLSEDPTATRAAIVGFFKTHLHVVRVRAMLGTRLITDLGGPFVLAPVSGVVRGVGGRVKGHFLLAVQDDMGYLLLAHNFTGAEVLMRVGSEQVMSTLNPGPESIPDHGPISYAGVRYQAFSFTGQAFPTGMLRISLLVPESS